SAWEPKRRKDRIGEAGRTISTLRAEATVRKGSRWAHAAASPKPSVPRQPATRSPGSAAAYAHGPAPRPTRDVQPRGASRGRQGRGHKPIGTGVRKCRTGSLEGPTL